MYLFTSVLGLYFIFLVPRFFLFYRFPITSAKVRRLFLVLYVKKLSPLGWLN